MLHFFIFLSITSNSPFLDILALLYLDGFDGIIMLNSIILVF